VNAAQGGRGGPHRQAMMRGVLAGYARENGLRAVECGSSGEFADYLYASNTLT